MHGSYWTIFNIKEARLHWDVLIFVRRMSHIAEQGRKTSTVTASVKTVGPRSIRFWLDCISQGDTLSVSEMQDVIQYPICLIYISYDSVRPM